MRPGGVAVVLFLCALPSPGRAQTCTEPHYRWTEKTTLSLAGVTPVYTSITQMLTSWGVPAIYGAADKCTDRAGRELKNYYLRGWARRRKAEADGDWHIELTATKTGAVVDNCVVIEIPPPSDGSQYQLARDQFTDLVNAAGATIASNGDLSKPVRMKVVGPAFFDGEHRGAKGTSNPPHQHGRCNRDSRSLWELHPVYALYAP